MLASSQLCLHLALDPAGSLWVLHLCIYIYIYIYREREREIEREKERERERERELDANDVV